MFKKIHVSSATPPALERKQKEKQRGWRDAGDNVTHFTILSETD